jgi:DNA-binding MurR/RpiR family transcriptional regulator
MQANFQIVLLKQIAKEISEADRKYVIGLRSSTGAAMLLGGILSQILPNIFTIIDGDTRLFESIKSIRENDVLIAISYPRYTKATITALNFAKSRKAKTIAITDWALSPAAQMAESKLLTPLENLGFENSYTACITMINALVISIAEYNKPLTRKMLKELEKSTMEFDFVYADKI